MSKYLLIILLCSSTFLSCAKTPDRSLPEGVDQQSIIEINAAEELIGTLFKDVVEPSSLSMSQKKDMLSRYQYLDPQKDVPSDLLENAVIYFDANKDKFPNQNYITIVDYKKKSDEARFFVVNLETGAVEKYHTSHGSGSDKDDDGIAEAFSNIPQSKMSSLGFVRTAEIYSGQFKRSLRLDGLSTTNSMLRRRAIIVHGWDEVHEANIKQGLSAGCPALDWAVKETVIDKIKNGSLMLLGFSKL
jgi:hypothetical protein